MARIAASVELVAFCHATEDPDKVKKALLNILPPQIRDDYEGSVLTELLEGYYGNPILILKLKINNSSHSSLAFMWIINNLSKLEISNLENNINLHLDKRGNLYLRIDKQNAFQGRIRLYEGDDVIRLKFKLLPATIQALKTGGLRTVMEWGADSTTST